MGFPTPTPAAMTTNVVTPGPFSLLESYEELKDLGNRTVALTAEG